MKTDRLLEIIIYLLNHEKVTAKQLANKFDVSVRTIQRDVDSISLTRVPILAATGLHAGRTQSRSLRSISPGKRKNG
ncbi:helix-turn-helix transcriptional regulator [Caproicibacter fermentans]|uniref:helix-turn-helix transcriptional regulator n=1 Tax=Caproicibacter fermentans TaxID=2576756 RepID=UPI001A9B9255